MSDAVSKRCNRCNEVDVTDFSTCKSCGQRYDVPKFKSGSSNAPLIALVVFALVGYGFWTCKDALYKAIVSTLTGNQGGPSMVEKPAPHQ